MGNRAPAFQFYVGDYIQDTRMVTLMARGAWVDLLCRMWSSQPRGQITSSYPGYARLFGCTADQAKQVICELIDANICDSVTNGHGDVTLMSRRMLRDEQARNQATIRQQKHRSRLGDGESNGDVTLPSSSSSSSSVEDIKQSSTTARRKRAAPLNDKEIVAKYQTDPAFAMLNVEQKWLEASAWCQTKQRQLTEQFFVNWLIRAEKPIKTNGNGAAPVAEHPKDCPRCDGLGMISVPGRGAKQCEGVK